MFIVSISQAIASVQDLISPAANNQPENHPRDWVLTIYGSEDTDASTTEVVGSFRVCPMQLGQGTLSIRRLVAESLRV